MKKRLDYFQIHSVRSYRQRDIAMQVALQPIPMVQLDGTVPEGCYCATYAGIVLPKRKRGQKFVVDYTEFKRVTL
jgi:hypothetical protein